jgi:hypothetical protein
MYLKTYLRLGYHQIRIKDEDIRQLSDIGAGSMNL